MQLAGIILKISEDSASVPFVFLFSFFVQITAVLFSTVTLTLKISLWFQLSDPFSDSRSS